MSEAGDAGERRVHGVPLRAAGGAGPGGAPGDWDATVLVTAPGLAPPEELRQAVEQAVQFDAALEKECGALACAAAWGGRLVLAPTGPLTPYHDVRSVYEAARAGVERAARAGSRRPVLVLQAHPRWPRAPLVALLAALETLYVPLQLREAGGDAAKPTLAALGAWASGATLAAALPDIMREAAALETARGLARDVGGADPERGCPLACARLVQAALAPLGVAVRVVTDAELLAREYPLLAAVSRAADSVPRHRGCVLWAEYCPANYKRTVMLVGKGVTYDTGGCDVKAGGVMAGMSRDKCGAAAVAGFVQACALLQADTRAVCALGLVRNSIGEEAYVADEVVVSRSGRRVRVGNTDAEGRMVMADLLAEMRERADKDCASADRPHLYTVATLTGHAARAVGEGYSIALDNHAAAAAGHAAKLRASGDSVADPFEVSTLRREDLKTHAGRSQGDDLHQADNLPSSAMPRGHQGPAAFLLLAAGLDQGDICYTHLDIAASAGSLPAPPTAAPLLALAAQYGLIRSC